MNSQHDVIVLGVGGMGSATACALARRGVDALGLERFDVPNAEGSSHGITRIIRLPQYEDPAYVPLVREALDLWRALEDGHPRNLLYRTGTLDFGPPDSEVFAGSKESCEVHGIDHQVLTGRDLTERVGGYDVPPEYRAVYQPDGGFVDLQQWRWESPGWLISVGDDAVAQLGPTVVTGGTANALKSAVGVTYLAEHGSLRRALGVLRKEMDDVEEFAELLERL